MNDLLDLLIGSMCKVKLNTNIENKDSVKKAYYEFLENDNETLKKQMVNIAILAREVYLKRFPTDYQGGFSAGIDELLTLKNELNNK